jgi:hypothetical protein
MTQEFIPYVQALALKELGFDEPCLGRWLIITEWEAPTGEIKLQLGVETECYDKNQCTAPLYQQAFRWFREKYVLLGFIEPANGYEDKSLFAFYICDDEQNIVDDSHSYSKDSSLHFRTYEEAELACLIKLIEILKTKNKL